jgi:hypothetical protein
MRRAGLSSPETGRFRFGTECRKNNTITKAKDTPDFASSALLRMGYCNHQNNYFLSFYVVLLAYHITKLLTELFNTYLRKY